MDNGNPFLTSDPRKSARERDAALRRQPLRQSWPMLVMIPALVGVLHASAYSLLIKLFLGKSFGLSGGNEAPWVGAIAVIFLASFWTNRFLGRLRMAGGWVQALTFLGWLAAYLAWIPLDPAYRHTNVWAHPSSFVQSDAYLIPPLLISMGIWWAGMSYAADIANLSAEEIRTVVQRDWIVLFASVVLAALVGGEAGRSALEAARLAVPILIIVSLALVAGAEVEATRKLAASRGGQAPGWGRWLRLVGGVAAMVLVLTLLVLALLSPGALEAVVGGIAAVARIIGAILAYILLAVIWAIFQIVIAITKVIEWLFGDVFGPIQQPEMQSQPAFNMDALQQKERETKAWEYAILLRWAGLAAIVMVAAFLLFRFTRRSSMEDEDGLVDEQRDSVFSADLARQQLRDLFRRRHRAVRPPRLDLDRPPASVRETMVYLETLAVRQGVGRRDNETPDDFTSRLRAAWPGIGAALIEFPHRYEHVRYGDEPDTSGTPDAEAARRDWARIWEARKNAPPPPPPPEPPPPPRRDES